MNIVEVSGSITRPSNTTAYTAGDVWANSTTAPTLGEFTNVVKGGGGRGKIVEAVLIDSSNSTIPGEFELWVFDNTVTQFNDNSAIALTDLECLNVVTVIPFVTGYISNTLVDGAGNRVYITDSPDKEFVCQDGSTSLYFMIVVRNAYTPIASEKLTAIVQIEQK
jgi:hypothetical protein